MTSTSAWEILAGMEADVSTRLGLSAASVLLGGQVGRGEEEGKVGDWRGRGWVDWGEMEGMKRLWGNQKGA